MPDPVYAYEEVLYACLAAKRCGLDDSVVTAALSDASVYFAAAGFVSHAGAAQLRVGVLKRLERDWPQRPVARLREQCANRDAALAADLRERFLRH